ncbi:MAG: hypothetical protein AAF961_01100 [Planctomycetota bacterium]
MTPLERATRIRVGVAAGDLAFALSWLSRRWSLRRSVGCRSTDDMQRRDRFFEAVEGEAGRAQAPPRQPRWIIRWFDNDLYQIWFTVRIDLERVESIDDACLAKMAALRQIDELDLSRTQVRGPGLADLQGVGLGALHLRGTALTDAGVEHLNRLKRLERLELRGSSSSAERVAELRQALPRTNILFP